MKKLSAVVLNLLVRATGKGSFRRSLLQIKERGPIERVIFVCTGNICRSPYAEAVFRSRTDGRISVISRGLSTTPGRFADATAQRIARERGSNLSTHRTERFDPGEISPRDLIVVMDEQHILELKRIAPERLSQTVFLGAFSEHTPLLISDPWGQSDEFFRECFRQIEEGVCGLLEELSI